MWGRHSDKAVRAGRFQSNVKWIRLAPDIHESADRSFRRAGMIGQPSTSVSNAVRLQASGTVPAVIVVRFQSVTTLSQANSQLDSGQLFQGVDRRRREHGLRCGQWI